MSDQTVTLINQFKVDPVNQKTLIAMLKDNIETVIRTLEGWKETRLMAAQDGASVVIYSQWASPAAVEAMRTNPRMTAYFPKIGAIAKIESTSTEEVLRAQR